MKTNRFFPGMLLALIGGYFLLEQFNITLFPSFFSWQTLIILIGCVFLISGYMGNDYYVILPAIILIGYGFHFHPLNKLPFWQGNEGMLIFLIGIGILIQYLKTKAGLSQALLLLFISLLFFNDNLVIKSLRFLEDDFALFFKIWPIILILIGAYLLFIKKK